MITTTQYYYMHNNNISCINCQTTLATIACVVKLPIHDERLSYTENDTVTSENLQYM